MVGTPVKVIATPDADYAYKSVVVNGIEISDTLFCPKEASTIEVNFKSTKVPYITVNVPNNTDMSFALLLLLIGEMVLCRPILSVRIGRELMEIQWGLPSL